MDSALTSMDARAGLRVFHPPRGRAIPPTSAECLSWDIQELAAEAASCLVRIGPSRTGAHGSGRSWWGSGVVWRSNGLIVTNAHVAYEDEVSVSFLGSESVKGRLIARDQTADLALLTVDALGLPATTVRHCRPVRVGELVVALGNPTDDLPAVTIGIIQAPPTELPHGGSLIRADCRLSRGYSGGPMLDAEGKLVGVNSMIAGGLGIAIPAARVAAFVTHSLSAMVDDLQIDRQSDTSGAFTA